MRKWTRLWSNKNCLYLTKAKEKSRFQSETQLQSIRTWSIVRGKVVDMILDYKWGEKDNESKEPANDACMQ